MKKVSSFIFILMLCASFVGCSLFGTPVTGTEGAKLLLANQRLNAEMLKNKNDIFSSGKETFSNLALKAEENFAKYVSSAGVSPQALGYGISFLTKANANSLKEISNSYGYLENITGVIISMANNGGKLIDDVKKHVRVVDKWVKDGDTKYYLTVEENSETLFSQTDQQLDICTRYKDELGRDVYELYISNDIAESRFKYIPGVRYEMTERFLQEDSGNLYFMADHSRGYWQAYVVGEMPTHFNVSALMLTETICSNADYDPVTESVRSVMMISQDRKTDILGVYREEDHTRFTISLNGFEGYSYVDNGVLALADGRKIANEQELLNGKVQITNIVSMESAYGIEASVEISARGESRANEAEILKQLISDWGLKCRRDLNTVISGVDAAYSEAEKLIKNYRWQGNSVKGTEGMKKATLVEKELLTDFAKKLDAIKNAEVIDARDTRALTLNINFAPVTANAEAFATYENYTVMITEEYSLSVADTTLFVENEQYVIEYALADKNGNLSHVEMMEELNTTTFSAGESFSVKATTGTMDFGSLESGEYTLVAYIATADGIRCTDFIPVKFGLVSSSEGENITKGANGELLITFENGDNVFVETDITKPLTYAELYDLMEAEAYVYGDISDAKIEKSTVDEATNSVVYVPLSGDETELDVGAYRTTFTKENKTAYIYMHLYRTV
ncbi:MAG: hypothetical protein IKB86_01560 [Clostridia bacterium]|nr:hypothetical protein [Clostridia bacterium]